MTTQTTQTKKTATQTTQKTANKAASKTVNKAANKPVVKTTAHGLTITMIASLDAYRARFVARAIEYHSGKGNVQKKADAFTLTPQGIKAFSGRPEIAHARECMTKGGKSNQGIDYIKAPPGFLSSYVFPFGHTQEEGRKDSQAAFGAMMLIASGK